MSIDTYLFTCLSFVIVTPNFEHSRVCSVFCGDVSYGAFIDLSKKNRSLDVKELSTSVVGSISRDVETFVM